MKDTTAFQMNGWLAARFAAAGINETMLKNAQTAAERLCAGAHEPAPGPLDPTGHGDYQALLTRLARESRS